MLPTYFAALGLLSLPATPLTDIFVDQSASGCASGTGAAGSPVCSITAALGIASPGDTIQIAPGTYIENVTVGLDVKLVGTQGATVTIIDGGQSGSVVTIPAVAVVEMHGLTVTNGLASRGGGIYLEGKLLLRNSTIASNRAKFGGGVLAENGPADLTIEQCVIADNSAFEFGKDGFAYAAGGGISQDEGILTISNSTIRDNSASASGYVDYFLYSSGFFFASGGGLSLSDTELTIATSTISGNRVSTGNSYSDSRGAAITNSRAKVEIANSTISNNTAESDPGLLLGSLSAGSRLSNTTITQNSSTGSPSPSSAALSFSGALESHNSVVAGNSPIDVVGPLTSLGFNLIGTGASGVTDGVAGDIAGSPTSPVDPFLGLLGMNGGLTETHAPLLGSPLLDAGDPLVFEPTDQRGISRPQGSRSDIGAVEVEHGFRSLCNGDGGNQMGCTDCPCMNNAPPGTVGGCINSAGSGSRLIASGDASVSLPAGSVDDLRFSATNGPAFQLFVLNSGEALSSADPMSPCFGLGSGTAGMAFDGLRCAIQNTLRNGGRGADSNGEVGVTNAAWGGESNPPGGIAQFFGYVAGTTRYFQCIHRDSVAVNCGTGLNTTQAIGVTFTP